MKLMRRAVGEILPPNFKKLWNDWDIRMAVLLSVTLQILLILLGNRRRHNSKLWIRIVLWCSYLAADAVATYALGVISHNLADLYDDDNDAGHLNANADLTAFWAPFLLLHLGGPDTITAYALEDNELWLRHLLGLVIQTGIALYVLIMAWTGSSLSLLSILMFLAGFIKYGERTWALRAASNDQLVESLSVGEGVIPPSMVSYVQGEPSHKSDAGYIAAIERINEIPCPIDLSVINSNSDASEQGKFILAYGLLDFTKRVFLESTLSLKSKGSVKTLYRNLSFENVFLVMEMELGFMFDLFYTKSPLLCTVWGIVLRLIVFFIICLTSVLFLLLKSFRKKCSKVDISITFSLLVIAIILEIYSAFSILFSDRFVIWLINGNYKMKTFILPAIKNSTRWSNKMCQLSLVSLFYNKKPLPCRHILKLLNINRKKLELRWYLSHKQVTKDLNKLVHDYLKYDSDTKQTSLRESNIFFHQLSDADRARTEALMNFRDDLGKSILFWHTLTEVLYYLQRGWIKNQRSAVVVHCKLIKQISRYMLYLLLVRPSALSVDGIDLISFQRTVDEYRRNLKGTRSKIEACEKLIEGSESTSGSLDTLFEGALLVAKTRVRYTCNDEENLWNLLSQTWLELMAYAAIKSKGRAHAQQLRRGGEFFTHVWLLMTHFGLTHHFEISELPEATGIIAI